MGKVAGVATKKNAKGEITHIAINMKKHGHALMPVFKSMGIIEQSQFERECEAGMTIEQSREQVYAKIDQLWTK